MNRKEFIKKSLAGLGLGLSTDLLFGQHPAKSYKIGIVGAGISGLHLGKALKEKEHDITIFEAKNRAGGRILENTQFHSSPIDLGAQWIHGKNELYKIATQNNFQTFQDTKNDLIKIRYKDGLFDDFPSEFYSFLKSVKTRTPLINDLSVLDFAKQTNLDPDFLSLVESAVTDTATSADRLSTNEISTLTKKLKTKDYQFSNTTMYGFMESNYLNSLNSNIIYGSPIKAIDYSGKLISITNDKNERYDFDKVILTIPITELKSDKIKFMPELPSEKNHGFKMIGMDKGLKLFLKFDKRFNEHSIFNGRHAGYYIDPSKENEKSGDSLLASLVMGNHAERYYENPDKAIENYLSELDGYFNGLASKHFLGWFAQDWGNEPYINGVYSYTLPNGKGAREIAKRAIDNKLYFAGEAMNTKKNYGNVHGAIESAIDVLRELT
jgi:monoamine oxidase